MLIALFLILVWLAALYGVYVGLVWLIARRWWAGDHWRQYLAAAIAACVVASTVLLVGVPCTWDSRGPVAAYAIVLVLLLTPMIAPRLPRPVAWLAAGPWWWRLPFRWSASSS